MPSDTSSLECEISTAISETPMTDREFNSLALKIFVYQYGKNTPYRNYCSRLGVSPEKVMRWQDIPAIPTDAFKQHDYPLVSFPRHLAHHTFHTSGTTTDTKGHHHFPSIELYEKSILAAWDQQSLPAPENAIYLTPADNEAPHSSLSHMMSVLSEHFSIESPAQWAIGTDGTIDIETIIAAEKSDRPVAILGTALAFLHVFDQLPHPIKLPAGSWAMETGGYKGSSRSLEKPELYEMFQSKLNLASDSVINEYSMTELSSQFYTHGLDTPHSGPHWTRIRIIDPISGTDAAPGTPGYLVIYDLANLHSVCAIRTQDIAIAHDNQSFTLLGRDPSALPRGCSRGADDSFTQS